MANKSHDDLELNDELTCESTILNASKMDLGVDIDSLLNEKAKKNQLNKRNVKLLIKNILTNDDVVTMLRQTLDENMDGNCLYEPKLTRARIREMLKTYPSSVDQWSQNQQQSIISECRSLIDNEFPDDSEDEEYKPEPQIEDDYDDDYDDIIKYTIQSSESDSVNTNEDQNMSINEEDTIGMRTRSKFPLNDTPLEMIEQAFIPPDITEDMYDSACENDEWMEFLNEFTKPLETVQNDDTEDDPEYNVLGDADFANVDKEEFRKDKSVKISRKEYNELMSELNSLAESYINFNGIEEYEDNDTTVTECEENTVTSENSNPSDTVYSDYLDSKPYHTNHSTYKNAFDNGHLSTTYTLSFLECNPNNDCITNDKNLNKSSKKSSLSFYKSNYSDWKSCNSLPNKNQMTEVAGHNSQIADSQPNAHHTIVNEHLVNNNYVIYNFTSKINPTKKDSTETTNSLPQNTASTDCDLNNCMSSKQIILLKQQLTQHVQLLTQSYLLCTMSRKYKSYCSKLKNMVELIKDVSNTKKFEPINVHSSLKFIQEWKTAQMYKFYVDKDYDELPLDVKEFMLFYDKPVFIYPELLPVRTFQNFFKTYPIGDSEERVLILKIDYIYKKLKLNIETRAKYKKQKLLDMLPVIVKMVHKRWFSFRKLTDIKQFINRRRSRSSMSLMKYYLQHGQIDETIHMVDIGPVFIGKCLYECNINKFPCSWKALVTHAMLKKCVKK